MLKFNPKTSLKKFGFKVFSLLEKPYPQTFFVGGMVRDAILKRKVVDIDIATQARPDDIIKILKLNNIDFDEKGKRFGVILANDGNQKIEITTFRKDIYSKSRYPKVHFVKTPKEDSVRRDFTINALYWKPMPKTSHYNTILYYSGSISDFHRGLMDIKKRRIRFIGDPEKRIQEDPLRILRAIRFAHILNFKFESSTKEAIVNNFYLIKQLSKLRQAQEIKKFVHKKK